MSSIHRPRPEKGKNHPMLIFGLPLSFAIPLIIHAWAGLAAVVTGMGAFCMPKQPGRHPRWGVRYIWAYTFVFLTATSR